MRYDAHQSINQNVLILPYTVICKIDDTYYTHITPYYVHEPLIILRRHTVYKISIYVAYCRTKSSYSII